MKRPSSRRLAMLFLALALVAISPFAASFASEPEAGPPPLRSGMFALYEENRERGIPNYITEDFLLLAYSMIRQQTVMDLETGTLLPAFRELVGGLGAALAAAAGPEGLANRDFIAVLMALLDGKTEVTGAGDPDRANRELALALAASGISPSPLWGMALDYSQFLPRGPYTASEPRKQYFRAMRYATSVLFCVKESRATGVTAELADRMLAQALQLSEAIAGTAPLAAAYERLDSLLAWQFGPADDLTLADLTANEAGPAKEGEAEESAAEARQRLLAFAREQGRQPRILANIVDRSRLEEGVSAEDALTGWRLLPQRYSPDAAAFQRLVYDAVREYQGKSTPFGLAVINGRPVKGFPSALELMAILGSSEAEELLRKDDATNFAGYDEARRWAQAELAGAAGLAGRQLLLLHGWLAGAEPAAAADPARRLTTALGFWTWQRYTGLLYQKQSVTPAAKGLTMDGRQGAWLEPAIPLYLGLAHLVAGHARMAPDPRWETFAAIVDRCLAIAWQELQTGALAAADESFLNGLDERLLALTGGEDRPIVVDVHTEPNSGQVVEEGIGFARVVTVDKGGADSARGALFTHRELKHPLAERLTDEKWSALLRAELEGKEKK